MIKKRFTLTSQRKKGEGQGAHRLVFSPETLRFKSCFQHFRRSELLYAQDTNVIMSQGAPAVVCSPQVHLRHLSSQVSDRAVLTLLALSPATGVGVRLLHAYTLLRTHIITHAHMCT